MANEGPATGAANNGPHEVNPDPSEGNVDAPHQRAETSSILGNLERMSNSSGLQNSPGLDRAAHPHTMLGELALGQIHNWQMGPPLFGLYPNGLYPNGLSLFFLYLFPEWTTRTVGLPPIGLPMTFGLPPFGLHPK